MAMIVLPLASYIDKSYLKDKISFYRFKLLNDNSSKKAQSHLQSVPDDIQDHKGRHNVLQYQHAIKKSGGISVHGLLETLFVGSIKYSLRCTCRTDDLVLEMNYSKECVG